MVRRVAAAEGIEIDDGAVATIARAATGSFRDALGTLDQLVAYGGKQVVTDDVLAVLGVADAELILAAADAIAAEDAQAPPSRRASGWRARAATWPSSCATCSPTCASCS